MHPSTFEYLKPTERQIARMAEAREITKVYADQLERLVPGGADRTYLLRKLREVAMWVNVAITREQDGTPRID